MRIGHVAVYVNDLEQVRDFYVKYFGAKASSTYSNFNTNFSNYWLTFDNNTELEIMQREGVIDQPKGVYRTGYHHLAITVMDRKEVDEVTKRIENDGYQVVKGARTTGDRRYASVVLDPEGNEIEIIAEGTFDVK